MPQVKLAAKHENTIIRKSTFLEGNARRLDRKDYDTKPKPDSDHQRNTFFASRGLLSLGQYGHLNSEPLLSLSSDSLAMTCPHGIIIGGFWSVPCSFETGQTKMEWK